MPIPRKSSITRIAVAIAFTSTGLIAQDVTLRNPFGVEYEPQPVEVPLDVVSKPGAVLVDENGQLAGQVSRDGKTAFMRVGFPEGETSRSYTLAKRTDAKEPAHPVAVVRKTWPASAAQSQGTAIPNGISEYFEITNGLCGVRVPAGLTPDALPAVRVPTPVVGAMFPGGQWVGRPDFRSLVVPARSSTKNGFARRNWRFTSFKGELVEEGPIKVVARITIGTDHRKEPYIYEVEVYADEQFIKITQIDGSPNNWFLDLNFDHQSNWRPTRWRSGANHHWFNDGAGPESGVSLPDRPGTSYDLKWSKGPGPANDRKPQKEFYGEGEGDLWSHDAWVEFMQDQWGYGILGHSGRPGEETTHFLRIRGQAPWFPWGGVGEVLYAFNHEGDPNSPVAALLTAPAGEITGWKAGDNPVGIVNFSQHVPSWLETNPYGDVDYLENWNYEGVADRSHPIFGVKFMMPMKSGSVFLWFGRNADIIPDINDERITDDYRSKPWLDWARFTNGVATFQDALAYTADWPDPSASAAGMQYIEDDVVTRNIARVRSGEDLGNWSFLTFWRQKDETKHLAELENFLSQKEVDIRKRLDRARTFHWGFDGFLQWYTFERSVAEALDTLALYFSLGREGAGGMIPEGQWQRLKNVASFFFHHTFDEDRALLWNDGVTINHGGGTMLSPALAARMGIIQAFPTWPDSVENKERPVSSIHQTLRSQIGRFGAQFTSTHYSSLAAITGPLADVQAMQFRSFTEPALFSDEFARDPRLRHHAHFVLNRMGVKDPRNGNRRVPIAVGNGGPGWGAPAAAILAAGFRHIDRPLAENLMWAWRENGKPNSVTPPLPKIVDYDMPSKPYSFPAISTFPGNMSIHRSAPHTPYETGVWITDGAFFNQHREEAESGEIHIDALGKPLVTNSLSYASPLQNNPLYKNVVAPVTEGWDADSRYVGVASDPWSMYHDRVMAIGSFDTGSYSRSDFGKGDTTWSREIILIRPDVEQPVIVVRDTLSKPADYMSTFWLQTSGEIATPGGPIFPPVKICPGTNSIVPTPEQSPSAVKISKPLSAGVNSFRFSGHDWLALYPKAFAKAKITEIEQPVDVEIHVVNAAPVEAVVGHWRTRDPANRFAWDDGSIDDRQYLRVKFSGTSLTTIFTPFLRGTRPADLEVTTNKNDIVVRYTNAEGQKRAILIGSTGYRVETDGKQTAAETFPTTLPVALYPGWNDLPYPGVVHPFGSPLPRVEVKRGPVWANDIYQQIPHHAITGMLTGKDGLRDPLARISKGGKLDTGRPCYRAMSGDRMTYLFALRDQGYFIARLPGREDASWLQSADATAATDPTAITKWTLGGAKADAQSTVTDLKDIQVIHKKP